MTHLIPGTDIFVNEQLSRRAPLMYTRLVALISVVLIRTYGDLDASCGVGKGNGMGDHVRNVLSISWRRAAWEGAYPVRVTSATLTSHLTNSGGEFDVSCRDIGTRRRRITRAYYSPSREANYLYPPPRTNQGYIHPISP